MDLCVSFQLVSYGAFSSGSTLGKKSVGLHTSLLLDWKPKKIRMCNLLVVVCLSWYKKIREEEDDAISGLGPTKQDPDGPDGQKVDNNFVHQQVVRSNLILFDLTVLPFIIFFCVLMLYLWF